MFKKLGLFGLVAGAALTLLPATAAAQDWHDHDGAAYGYYHRDGERAWERHERREQEEREWRRRRHQEQEWREHQWREQRRYGYDNYNQYAPSYYGNPYTRYPY